MQVEHDTVRYRFMAQVPSGTAVLSYAPHGSGVLNLYSTHVPEPDRGRGVGASLVQAALKYAREQGMRIIPSCSYVAQWIREHPEDQDLVAAR
jgi:predicted GNAT family acetyltransferase